MISRRNTAQVRRMAYKAPALQFEMRTGLRGIRGIWHMPRGQTHEEVELTQYADCQRLFNLGDNPEIYDEPAYERIVALFEELKTLNPALEAFEAYRSKPKSISDVMMGVTSQFNLNDIQNFIEVPTAQYNMDVRNKRLWRMIEARAGVFLGWRPSPATLSLIWQQMDEHPVYRQIRVRPVLEDVPGLTAIAATA